MQVIASKTKVDNVLDLGDKNREKKERLQTFGSSYLLGKSDLENDGAQNCLVSQPSSLKMLTLISILILDLVLDLMRVGFFSLLGGNGTGKYIIIFGVDNGSYVQVDNKKKIS